MKQNIKKYINLSYYNNNVLIFGWVVCVEGFSNLPTKRKCRGVVCPVNNADHEL
jgi:hypothetical protein